MDAPLPELIAAIQPGGLAPTKAPRIQAVLRDIQQRRGGFDLGFLADLPLDEARAWLGSLHGVGPKTVACVLLFALGRPAMPVDTHVFRVAQRLGLIPGRVGKAAMTPEKAHALLEAAVAPQDYYAFHIGLIKHGRRTCAAQRPHCDACVLRDLCPSAGDVHTEGRKNPNGLSVGVPQHALPFVLASARRTVATRPSTRRRCAFRLAGSRTRSDPCRLGGCRVEGDVGGRSLGHAYHARVCARRADITVGVRDGCCSDATSASD